VADGSHKTEFERESERAGKGSGSPLVEFWHYLRQDGKWWLTPIIAALLLAGVLIVLGGTSAAPMIYALF
jgi:hypothetical protein